MGKHANQMYRDMLVKYDDYSMEDLIRVITMAGMELTSIKRGLDRLAAREFSNEDGVLYK